LKPAIRLVIDNDFGGDPDGLFQLAHHFLSPSVDIRAVISSHLRAGDGWNQTSDSVAAGISAVCEVAGLCGVDVTVLAGSREPLVDINTPQPSAALEFLKEELERDDDRRLYFVCGGSLTQLASLQLSKPKNLDRLTAIWIGGPEHASHAYSPPGAPALEYNLAEDPIAGQVVFDHTDYAFWQIPRNVYRQTLMSQTELEERVKPEGELGAYLYSTIENVRNWIGAEGHPLAETYIMGDSPLVLLTALQSLFEADPSSSFYELMPSPRLNAEGQYVPNPHGIPIRVYKQIDTRLMFEDFYLKLRKRARNA